MTHEDIQAKVAEIQDQMDEAMRRVRLLDSQLKEVRAQCPHDGPTKGWWNPYEDSRDAWVECLICGGKIPGAVPEALQRANQWAAEQLQVREQGA